MYRNQERCKEGPVNLKDRIPTQLLIGAAIALGKTAAENVHLDLVNEDGQWKLVLAFGPPSAAKV